MRARISFVRRSARKGATQVRTEVAAETLRFGRSSDCEVHLPDSRVRLYEARLRSDAGRLTLEEEGGSARTLRPGDAVDLGPYRVGLAEPPVGFDLDLSVELLRAPGDDYESLAERSTTDLSSTRLSMRALSWGLVALVAVAAIGLPLFGRVVSRNDADGGAWVSRARSWWSSGQISRAHRFTADRCEVCHERAFVPVTDSACLGCHAAIERHVDVAGVRLAALERRDCASCHPEHDDGKPAVVETQTLCTGCHAAIRSVAAETQLANASDFGHDHPEFRPRVIADAAAMRFERTSLDVEPPPQERSNLKFSHRGHLAPEGVLGPEGRRVLGCSDCHEAGPGDAGFLQPTMERHCVGCHRLRFDPVSPERSLPHGRADAVLTTLREFYTAAAVAGNPRLQDSDVALRRRPGAPVLEPGPEAQALLQWVERQTRDAAARVFGETVCGECHVALAAATGATAAAAATAATDETRLGVRPVYIARRWMPAARFDHDEHAAMDCEACHAASVSTRATDVLLPGIETCRDCHAGAGARGAVPSTCIDCHDFHRAHLPPMRAAGPTRETGPPR